MSHGVSSRWTLFLRCHCVPPPLPLAAKRTTAPGPSIYRIVSLEGKSASWYCLAPLRDKDLPVVKSECTSVQMLPLTGLN
jgi:hypothetical protein